MNKILITIIAILCVAGNISTYSQTYVNQEWETASGSPVRTDWSSSIVNSSDEIISVGNTAVIGEGANIFITKYDIDGNTIWERNFNTSGTNNDFGINLTEDNSGNIYVVGTTDNSGTSDFDIVILKYTSNGTLSWSSTYNSAFSKNDVGTAIRVDGSGNAYVCGASEGDTTNYDYLILKYDGSGTISGESRYDYNSLADVPIGVEFSEGNVLIVGASASTIDNWDYTIVEYNTSVTFVSDNRNTLAGIGFDHPLAFKRDKVGSLYITGSVSSDGINYDINTIKLDSDFVLKWTTTLDYDSLKDESNAIDIDDSGNVYIGGFVTKGDSIKNLIVIKYDTSGAEIWRHEQSSFNTTGDAYVKSIDATTTGEVYFAAVEKGINSKDAIISKIDINGVLEWQKKICTDDDEDPFGVYLANDGSLFLHLLFAGSPDGYQILKYTELKKDQNVIVDSLDVPICMANELIVRFKSSAINIDAIDNNYGNSIIEYAGIDYFLDSTAMVTFNEALDTLCTPFNSSNNPFGIKAFKVFEELLSTDSVTISRLGDTIQVPDFWTTLILVFPECMNIGDVHNAFVGIPDIVKWSEPNFLIGLATGPNDTEYPNQKSLHTAAGFTDADINMEAAWTIYDAAPGNGTVRCGVFDSGLDWIHEDFGFDGVNASSSKVIDGYDYETNTKLKANKIADSYGHGTPCGGIIGAIRNNIKGIAGIAGANGANKGVELYSLKIMKVNLTSTNGTVDIVADAILTTAMAPKGITSPNNFFGLNVSSNSWRYSEKEIYYTAYNNALLAEVVHFVNRAQVTFVACRGNEGYDNLAIPAIIDDDWVLNVGGTGTDGCFIDPADFNGEFKASFGHNIDISAPATTQLVRSLQSGGGYRTWSGTSASTPQVAGLVCLMMSYLNAPGSQYQNLAPEDCEYIIEKSAKSNTVCIATPNQYVGAGLLDAGKAMQLIEKPFNIIQHFGTKNSQSPGTPTQWTTASPFSVYLKEPYTNFANQYFPVGTYTVIKYNINVTFSHSIGGSSVIKDYWPRPSMSNVLEDVVYVNSRYELSPRERVVIGSCTQTSCSMTGYVYKVFNGSIVVGWWPFSATSELSKAVLEYSLRIQFATGITTQKNSEVSMRVYPNPTATQNVITLENNENLNVKIDLFDIQGKKIKTVYSGIGITEISCDLTPFSSGIYFYEINMGDIRKRVKFVKL